MGRERETQWSSSQSPEQTWQDKGNDLFLSTLLTLIIGSQLVSVLLQLSEYDHGPGSLLSASGFSPCDDTRSGSSGSSDPSWDGKTRQPMTPKQTKIVRFNLTDR